MNILKTSGINLFTELKAEEEEWLPSVYVFPNDFETLLINRPVIVFGKPGSGKTALRIAIEKNYNCKIIYLI